MKFNNSVVCVFALMATILLSWSCSSSPVTPIISPTLTPTPIPPTWTSTPHTPTTTFTFSNTPTSTMTNTATNTNVGGYVNTCTHTPTITNTITLTATNSASNTFTIIISPTLTSSPTQTGTATYTISSTFTLSYTVTNTCTNTPTGVWVTTLAGGGSAGATVSGSMNGTGVAAEFNSPEGVAVDGSGNVYVGDSGNNLIRIISAGGVVTTLAGGGSSGGTASGNTNATGTSATFDQPRGLAVDSSGNVYAADAENYLIRKVTSGGVVSTLAGDPIYGEPGDVDGAGVTAEFNDPTAVAVDSSGVVYVADTGNGLIRKISTSDVVSTFAGGGLSNTSGYNYANGAGTRANFYNPFGIAVDSSGNLYVADTSNNIIRKIDTSGNVTTLAGGGSTGGTTSGYVNANGMSAEFNNPLGVTVDSSGNVYVADTSNNVIRKIIQ